jgi:hypothetical protein
VAFIPRSQCIITGAADDDPSGIATYSVAGAQFGTSLLWTAFISWPLMAAVQMMCARIGKVTGQGLAGNVKQRFPKGLLMAFVIALLAANTINIGADLAGMADAVAMPYFVGNGPASLLPNCERPQVAGPCALRISHYRVCCGSRLGPGAARHTRSVHAAQQR